MQCRYRIHADFRPSFFFENHENRDLKPLPRPFHSKTESRKSAFSRLRTVSVKLPNDEILNGVYIARFSTQFRGSSMPGT